MNVSALLREACGMPLRLDWLPPVDIVETLVGLFYLHGGQPPMSILFDAFPPARTLEVLHTLRWLSARWGVFVPNGYSNDETARADSLSVLTHAVAQLHEETKEAKKREAMTLTADSQRAASLLEEARELLPKDPGTAMAKLTQVRNITSSGKMPVMHALAQSLTAQAHLAVGDRASALAEGLEAVKVLRDVGLALEAVRLERALEAPAQPASGLLYVRDKNDNIVPVTAAMLQQSVRATPAQLTTPTSLQFDDAVLDTLPFSRDEFAHVLRQLRDGEFADGSPMRHFRAPHAGSVLRERVVSRLPGATHREELARWASAADWLLDHDVAHTTERGVVLDANKLNALIMRCEGYPGVPSGSLGTGADSSALDSALDRSGIEKERDIMAEIKEKVVGAAVSTGTGVVAAFQEGIAIAGSQELSDRIVKIFHEKVGHNIPVASSPLGQQIERVMIPALVHLVAGMLPDKVPGSETIQKTCMRAITGVAKDDGTAMLRMLLPVAGEVFKISTAEGGLDFAAMMMGQTKVEQVGSQDSKALAPTAEVNALSEALAKGLESAAPGEEVEVKMTVRKGKRNGKAVSAPTAEEAHGVVPPFEPNPTR